METYLFKMILCSAIFIGFYYLVLERQKSHQFKRFYLLSSILFSILIPFASIAYGVEQKVSEDLIFIENQSEIVATEVVEKSIFTVENIIYGAYFLVTAALLLRFLISLNELRKEISTGKRLKNGKFILILKDDKVTAHSFWKFIFLNRKDFEEGKINEKIIRHEELHLQQKHSVDVLLIEFLLVIFWFNPAFYFYKKAIITNHEFLADEHVLKLDSNIQSYQQLLLSELISERILFTNQFNLSNTKKRIKMMTTRNNKKSKFYNWLSLPLAAVMFMAFAEKVPATVSATEKVSTTEEPQPKPSQKILESDNPFEEFQQILSKYSGLLKDKKYLEFGKKLTAEDKKRLNELFPQLTAEQKELIPITVVNRTGESLKNPPVDSQLKDFLDLKTYGVWIDDQKVKNEVLKNYKSSDFASVFVSKVHKNAQSAKNPQPFQVNFMTNKYFEDYNSKEHIMVGIKKDFDNGQGSVKQQEKSTTEIVVQEPIPAEFPGGISAFRNKLMEKFNSSLFSNHSGLIKTTVYFDIDENGNVSNFRAEGADNTFNTEAAHASKEANGDTVWKPAMENGKPVKTQFKLPMTMNFEK